MVRAAAKNHAHVGVVTSPADYAGGARRAAPTGRSAPPPGAAWPGPPSPTPPAYDAAIVAWFDAAATPGRRRATSCCPPTLHLTLERAQVLRYGENPHQRGARYRAGGATAFWDGVVQHGGAALSYLNLFDADAAWRLAHELAADAGGAAAWHHQARQRLRRRRGRRPDRLPRPSRATRQSAFGGIVALGGR